MIARQEAAAKEKEFQEFTKSFNKENVAQWEKDVQEWEADMKKPDPYHVASTGASVISVTLISLLTTVSGPSQAQIKKDIAREEQAKAALPGHVAVHKISALGFITMGLELEESQCVIVYCTLTTVDS